MIEHNGRTKNDTRCDVAPSSLFKNYKMFCWFGNKEHRVKIAFSKQEITTLRKIIRETGIDQQHS